MLFVLYTVFLQLKKTRGEKMLLGKYREVFIENNLCGPIQFKPMSFKGQLHYQYDMEYFLKFPFSTFYP